MKVDGSLALVTGGAKGLGMAITQRLLGNGAKVAVFDRDAAALKSLPSGALGMMVDVTQPKMVKAAVADLVAKHGPIQVLINNAGVIFSEPFINLTRPSELMHNYERFR